VQGYTTRQPSRPQQNRRHERMHWTLKEENDQASSLAGLLRILIVDEK
jgi:hypothetical protein